MSEGVTHYPMPYPPPADAQRRIVNAVAQHRPDVMHVIGGGVRLMWAAHGAACEAGVGNGDVRTVLPWVVSVHNIPPQESTAPWLQGRNALHYPLRNLLRMPSAQVWHRFLRRGNFARAICHSAFIADAARRAGCPTEKTAQIPLGCDLDDACDAGHAPADHDAARAGGAPDESLFVAEASPRIVSVGGMAHHKGFHDYLHVVHRLVAHHPKLQYVIMGDKRDRRYYHMLGRLIARLGLDEHVMLVPHAPESQRLATARHADLYVVPSHEEGFCLSYLEGATLAPRVLGTRCGAIAQMAATVGDDPGQMVVEPGDIEALERATRQLLAVDVPPATCVRRRMALARRYDWRQYTDAHLALYRALTDAPALRDAG